MDFIKLLASWGLTDYEAKTYLSAMELGPSPVQKIADHAKLNRVSAYNFIKSLIEKGLMSSFEQGKKTMYVASDPRSFENFFDQRKRSLEDHAKELSIALPQLRGKFNVSKQKPTVRFYEGFEGAMVMHAEMVEHPHTEIEMIYNLDVIDQYIPDKIKHELLQQRVKRNIKTKVIYSSSKRTRPSTADGTRYQLNDPNLPIQADVTLYENKVRFLSFGKDISGIIIEDPQIATTMRTLFRLALKALKNKKT